MRLSHLAWLLVGTVFGCLAMTSVAAVQPRPASPAGLSIKGVPNDTNQKYDTFFIKHQDPTFQTCWLMVKPSGIGTPASIAVAPAAACQ
jgi:hypothetical protein